MAAGPERASDIDTRVKIVWGLYVLSVVTGVTALIGVAFAYAWRKTDPANPMTTHFDKQIRVFWISLALTVVGLILSLIAIGFIVLFFVGVYIAAMGVIGLLKAFDNKPWP